MNETTVFSFENNPVRIQMINNEPWFVAKDVADILGYSETAAMNRRLDEDEKTTLQISQDGSSNYKTNITLINESGLYNAILGSNKTEAKAFKRWVTHEVLPSIRKTGTYSCDPVVRKFVEEVQKKASAQVRRDLAAARNAAITSLQNAGYSVDLDIIKTFTLEDCESNPAMQRQMQNKVIRQIVDPRFVATVKMEIESKETTNK